MSSYRSAPAADAVDAVQPAQVNLSVRDRQRAVALVADRVLGDDLELRTRLDDIGDALVGHQIEVSVRVHRRAAVVVAKLMDPEPLARLRLETVEVALVRDHVEPVAIRD